MNKKLERLMFKHQISDVHAGCYLDNYGTDQCLRGSCSSVPDCDLISIKEAEALEPQIYTRALLTFDTEPQLRMVQEECGELVVVLNQYLRGRATNDEVLSELCDVEIMLTQLKDILDLANYRYVKARKLRRLHNYIEQAKNDK